MAPSAQRVAVFGPLIIGLPTTLGTIVIHGIAVVAIIYFVRYQLRSGRAGVQFWTDLRVVASVTIIALMAHLFEIVVWAMVFWLCGEFTQVGHCLLSFRDELHDSGLR